MNFLIILILILCVLLTLVILIQNPKGGGLSSSIGGFSNQTMGVKRTTETLEKATWYLMGGIALLVLLTATPLVSPTTTGTNSQPTESPVDLNKPYPGEPRSQTPAPATVPGVTAPGGQAQPAPEGQPAAAPAENAPEPAESN